MIYFLSALAGAFFMAAAVIVAVCWDVCDGKVLLMEASTVIGGIVFLLLAMNIGG